MKKLLKRLFGKKTKAKQNEGNYNNVIQMSRDGSFKQWETENKKLTKEREEEHLRLFLKSIVKMINEDESLYETEETTEPNVVTLPVTYAVQNNAKKSKKPLFLRLAAGMVAACVVCLAVVLPIVLNAKDPGGEPSSPAKHYSAVDARVLGADDGIFFEDVYAAISANEGMVVFNSIISASSASIELSNDDNEELLSYVLYNCVVDASGESLVVFTVDFRVRIYNNYEFIYYDQNYTDLTQNFSIGDVQVLFDTKIKNENTAAFITFKYGEYDYFLKVSVFEMDGMGVVTPISESNLILLIENLIL